VGHLKAVVVGDDVIVDSQDGLRVRFDPRHLLKFLAKQFATLINATC
jgi:hypothetical protein